MDPSYGGTAGWGGWGCELELEVDALPQAIVLSTCVGVGWEGGI